MTIEMKALINDCIRAAKNEVKVRNSFVTPEVPGKPGYHNADYLKSQPYISWRKQLAAAHQDFLLAKGKLLYELKNFCPVADIFNWNPQCDIIIE